MKVELNGLVKDYISGGISRRVLEIPEFTADFPHVLALLGPSGGGKSTLLRILAGLERPDAGRVAINGTKLPSVEGDLRLYRASIGIVFQAFNLFPHMSALRNVTLPLTEVHGMSSPDARARAMEVMGRLGLADHAGKFPDQLSGGQAQRVAIARALAPRPKLLLFDEPTSALDPEMTAEVLAMIEGLRQEGVPMVLVTHQTGFARRISDRVAFLSGGRILEERPAGEFFANPRSAEAQRFLAKVLAY
jgi:polar amino acid transport system ATP-binding protein